MDIKEPDYEKEKSYYVVIPTSVWDNEELEWKIKRLYGRIVSLTKKDGYCWGSDKFLSEDLGINIRTAKRYLRKLEELNLIKRITTSQPGGGWNRKIYLARGQECPTKGTGVKLAVTPQRDKLEAKDVPIVKSTSIESLGPEQILASYLKCENLKGEKLETPQSKVFQIIAFYWVLSNQKITNNEQWKNFVKRNIRIAQDIVKQEFSPDDLLEASSLLRAKGLSWTLETLASWIPRLKQETENLKPWQKKSLVTYTEETFNLIQSIILDHGTKTTTKQ